MKEKVAKLQAELISLRAIVTAKDNTIAYLQEAVENPRASPSESPSPNKLKGAKHQRFDPSMSRKERKAWKDKGHRQPSPGKRVSATASESPLFQSPSVDQELAEAVKRSFPFGPNTRKPKSKNKPSVVVQPVVPRAMPFTFGPAQPAAAVAAPPSSTLFNFGHSSTVRSAVSSAAQPPAAAFTFGTARSTGWTS
jgi:hypothetical protein